MELYENIANEKCKKFYDLACKELKDKIEKLSSLGFKQAKPCFTFNDILGEDADVYVYLTFKKGKYSFFLTTYFVDGEFNQTYYKLSYGGKQFDTYYIILDNSNPFNDIIDYELNFKGKMTVAKNMASFWNAICYHKFDLDEYAEDADDENWGCVNQ